MNLPAPSKGLETGLLMAILLLAGALRFARPDLAPPGLSHDEADHVLDAAGVVAGIRPIYFTVGYGREPLYDYATALLMPLIGQNYLASRLTSGLFGMAVIVLTYLLIRRGGGGPWPALMTAAGLAVGFWPVSQSRFALRTITQPALMCAAALLTFTALGEDRRRRWAWWALAGLMLGAGFYTYLPARIMWAVFPAFALMGAALGLLPIKRGWPAAVIVPGLALLTAAPLFLYLRANPQAEARLGQLDGPIDALWAGDPLPLLINVRAGLGMLAFQGDDLWLYNIPGKPLLGPAWAGLGLLGIGLAAAEVLRARRCPAAERGPARLHLFMLLMLLAGLAPALIVGVGASNTRVIGLLPALYYFPAVGALGLITWARHHTDAEGGLGVAVAFGGLVLITAGLTVRAYFGVWANAEGARVAYHATLVDTLAHLDAEPQIGPVVGMASITPGPYHDPAVAFARLRRDDLRLMWFDGRDGLIFPADEDHVTWVFPEVTWQGSSVLPLLRAGQVSQTRLETRPGEFNNEVLLIDWQGAVPGPASPLPAATAGGLLTLYGWAATPQAGCLDVLTWWRAEAVPEQEVVLFTQALGPDGALLAQADKLSVPASGWEPGAVIIQAHRLCLPEGSPYTLITGAYTLPGIERLLFTAEAGQSFGDYVVLR